MSPVQPAGPDRAGSVRQPACFWPVSSSLVVSQSCAYSACTTRSVPEQAVGDHLACLPDHGIAGVVVGQHEHAAGLVHEFGELACILKRGGQRLVADDVNAAFKECLRGRKMHVVGRDDRHCVDPVLAPRLALGHLGEVGVTAARINPELLARGLGSLCGRGKSASDEFVAPVQSGSDAMHAADEGTLAATHHAQPQPAAWPGLRL